jgi:ribosomal protein S12 methylthiotransferase accessory factor
MPASETLARVMPILGDFGITRVARHTGLDNIGIPVWCAYAPNSRSIVVAQGKGLSDDDAKASAVMEALERAVAGSPAVETVRATAHALRASKHQVMLLDCLIGVGKADIGAAEEIEWACAEELLSGTPVYVPVDAAILDRTRNCRFWISSDGLASGNILEEAVLHGVLERIERDAHVMWQIGSDQARFSRCVDPEAFDDPSLDDLVADPGNLRCIGRGQIESLLGQIVGYRSHPGTGSHLTGQPGNEHVLRNGIQGLLWKHTEVFRSHLRSDQCTNYSLINGHFSRS